MPFVLLTVLALALPLALPAQTPKQDSAATVDPATRAKVVEGVVRRIEEGYIFPDKAKEMALAVRGRARRGEYDRIGGAIALADRLTQDLRAVSRDRHIQVYYDGRGVVDEVPDAEPTAEERRERAILGRRVNWGFERVERLNGNVGYLEIRSFNFEADAVDSTLAGAMSFLAHTDALIIDVRRNGGGDPNMVAAVCSYLMPPNTLVN
jgi:retinol-binding protein 3